ncbi:MAG TPA: right-handed parallel beta-helix repeat-containing protein [Nitrososphaeraceae archaeon]|nr:right-handed parallel beta-helix repeat-containing protein [Nitrososphaeraceae archaeon]
MTNLGKNATTFSAILLFLFLLTGLISFEQHHIRFTAEAGVDACIDFDQTENTIKVNCNASFLNIVQTINDPKILENLENGEYLLNATLEVADDITFEMNSSGAGSDNLRYLKIAGENGIIVYGKILIDSVKITSWNISSNNTIPQDMNGNISRGYIQFGASEGSQIINSEFGYLGDVEPGRRGFDLLGDGDGEPSHDMVIRGSKFHDMWFAFYSNGAYNIVIDGNEYYNNIQYTVDPHSATHDMNITNNNIHHNRIGVICSLDCYNILIDGNKLDHNSEYGIFFSRNMHDSIARNNHVYNSSTGIMISESPNNEIHNNTIERATSHGIRLFNPILPDDGFTEGNLVYNNTIISSQNGIVATRSHDNIVQNTTFSDIESSEYRLSGDSSIILGQQFENASISHDASGTTIRQRR